MAWIYTILWLFAICLAGSDGPWFPWINILGAILFLFSSCMIMIELS